MIRCRCACASTRPLQTASQVPDTSYPTTAVASSKSLWFYKRQFTSPAKLIFVCTEMSQTLDRRNNKYVATWMYENTTRHAHTNVNVASSVSKLPSKVIAWRYQLYSEIGHKNALAHQIHLVGSQNRPKACAVPVVTHTSNCQPSIRHGFIHVRQLVTHNLASVWGR